MSLETKVGLRSLIIFSCRCLKYKSLQRTADRRCLRPDDVSHDEKLSRTIKTNLEINVKESDIRCKTLVTTHYSKYRYELKFPSLKS